MGYQVSLDDASFGKQRPLIITQWPLANTTLKSADQPRLIDQSGASMVDGTYYCRVEIGGLSVLALHTKATFGAGSVTVTAVTTYYINGNIDDATVTTNSTYQTFTGTGALATTVRQDAALAALVGEQFAIVKIVVAGGAAPVFTMAEINGTR